MYYNNDRSFSKDLEATKDYFPKPARCPYCREVMWMESLDDMEINEHKRSQVLITCPLCKNVGVWDRDNDAHAVHLPDEIYYALVRHKHRTSTKVFSFQTNSIPIGFWLFFLILWFNILIIWGVW